MWLYLKSLFMAKDPSIAKDMVDWYQFKRQPTGLRLSRILRRRARRNKFKAHNTTNLKSKVK